MPKIDFVALSAAQVEIMESLWRSRRRTSLERLRQMHPVKTFDADVKFLAENNFVSVEKVRGCEMVSSLVTEETGLKAMVMRVKQLASAASRGSVLRLVQAITSGQMPSKKVQAEIDRIIEKMN